MAKSEDFCNLSNVVAFIHDHQADANTLGALLIVPSEYILGLSGWESQWGANRFAKEGNNFFSLHGNEKAPYANGSMAALKPPYALLSKFPSYLASGQSFIAQYGTYVRGAKTSLAFAQGLVSSGFNSGNAATGGNPNFIANTQTGIAMVVKRKAC